MLTVSNRALEKFNSTIAAMSNGHTSGATEDEPCLRMVRDDETGLVLELETARPEDDTYELHGRTVLAVPEELSVFCDDKTLDVDSAGNLTLA